MFRAVVPSHAYVPGQTARHPDDWFDVIKASVSSGVSVDTLDQTEAWKAGLYYFHAGYFWECHEVLEAVWMRTGDPSPERAMTQAVIQLANARLKLRMDRPNATQRLCGIVDDLLAQCAGAKTILGIEVRDVASWMAETRKMI
ncbi:DUF309 domain-containing protein [Sulfitobacter sp. HGT1]|uniref:DUF309 domain-containing protein n=1 Tax=Sulfitobacter sp. HGT1 TaxID=2735435 RepID=UPI00159322C6|nr:DUF309 domain-containing protein [Sulfitobacter sp. HGT1]MBQ0803960.1 DUF309 domain-containing protein [Sulfitobacter sp.]